MKPSHDPVELGAYTAERAAALSGVPKSTVHYWARNGILVPSTSAEKVKLWSYADLCRLRLIQWLRQPKQLGASEEIPATSTRKIRKALEQLRNAALDIRDADGRYRVFVDEAGHIFIRDSEQNIVDGVAAGQLTMPCLDLYAPFAVGGITGPDLVRPRPALRIIPGRLSGSPHIEHTRLETVAIAALRARGLSVDQLKELYPFARKIALRQAIDLEHQLSQNLMLAA